MVDKERIFPFKVEIRRFWDTAREMAVIRNRIVNLIRPKKAAFDSHHFKELLSELISKDIPSLREIVEKYYLSLPSRPKPRFGRRDIVFDDSRIRRGPGVYLLYWSQHDQCKPFYIGKTDNLLARLNELLFWDNGAEKPTNHTLSDKILCKLNIFDNGKDYHDFLREQCNIELIILESEMIALFIEDMLIEVANPCLNGRATQKKEAREFAEAIHRSLGRHT